MPGPKRPPAAKPVLWLDPADAAATARDFAIPERRVPVERVVVDGVDALRFTGEGSAGVDLDENRRERGDRVEIAFCFRIESGDVHVQGESQGVRLEAYGNYKVDGLVRNRTRDCALWCLPGI